MRIGLILLFSLLSGVGLSGCECGGENYWSDCVFNDEERPQQEQDPDLDPDNAQIAFLNQVTAEGATDEAAVELDLLSNVSTELLFQGKAYSGSDRGDVAQIPIEDASQTVSFDVRSSSQGTTLVSNQSQTLEGNTRYTLVAMGPLGDLNQIELAVLTHNGQSPGDTEVNIRFVNTLSESARPLDVIVDGETVTNNLDFGDDGSYESLTPSSGTINIALRDSNDDTVAEASCEVTPGGTYTGILGYAEFDQVDDSDISLFCHAE